MNEIKLDILKDLIIDEEPTDEDLKRLVEKSKNFLKIENKTGKIIISPDFPFIVSDKIIIFLIGIYFSKEYGLNKDVQITSRLISENINVAQTTISGPLGDYVRNKIVSADDNSYSIKYYEIENQLDQLTNKYVLKKKSTPKVAAKLKIKKVRKKIVRKKETHRRIKPKTEREIDEDSLKNEFEKHDLTEDGLHSVFNVNDGNIILLRGWKGTTAIESQVKSTLLLLTANNLFFGLDEMNSSELRKSLIGLGVPMANHSTNIKNFATLIIHKRGPIGSTSTSYKITHLGFQKSIDLIQDTINNTSNFDIQFKHKIIRKEKSETISIDEEKLNQNISDFVKELELKEERLRTLFDFQTDNVRFCLRLKEGKRKILQIKSLMLLGIILKKIYDVNNFNGKTLLQNSRISYDRLDLLDSNKNYQRYFSTNKPKSAMQLTYAGENRAIEMLKEYLNKEDSKL